MKRSIYEEVTKRIIDQLEAGNVPWEKPWTGVYDGAYNRVTKRSYSLLNQLLLQHTGEYASYKQWASLGGQVRKGEKSEMVVFWKPLVISEKTETKEGGTGEKRKTVPVLRYYNVFHISQVDGVEPLEEKGRGEVHPIENAQGILNTYWRKENIKIRHEKSNEAFYSPATDSIHLPAFSQFTTANGYYSTAFHESIHSTMKKTRCDRESECGGKDTAFGSAEYSKEKLVAEIGAAFLMNLCGIETPKTFQNSEAYIRGWVSVLRNDVKFIVSASSKAEKAAKYILGKGVA